MQKKDLRPELKSRMNELQERIDQLEAQRATVNRYLQKAWLEMSAYREAYDMETERLGESSLPQSAEGKKFSRFAGMRLVDAVALIRKEQPEIDKRQVRTILEKEGFDFQGKKSLQAVNLAWVAVDNRKRKWIDS